MGQFIVKLKEHYLIWSSIVDAPISKGMNLQELEKWIRDEYGEVGVSELPSRLARVEAKGTSSMQDESAVDTIWLNRAGPNESTLTIEGIYRHYCLDEPVQDEWILPERVFGGDDEDDTPGDGPSLYDRVVGNWLDSADAQGE